MLGQFKVAYESGAEDEASLGEHVAMYLQSSAVVVPEDDLPWVWELLVASRQSVALLASVNDEDPLTMDTPLRRLSATVRAMLQPLPLSTVHSNMQHFHGLPSVCNALLSVCFSTSTAYKVLSVLLETLLPDYHVASMSGFRVDWKVVDLTLARLDPSLSRHLAELNVSIEVLCSQWFFSMFADALPPAVSTQLYTWVLASSTASKSSPHPCNWLVATALALLLFAADVLHAATDATTVTTLLHHFCHVVLSTDEHIRNILLQWIHAFHLHFHDALHACRVDMTLDEDALPRRIFIGWRHPPTTATSAAVSPSSSEEPSHARWRRTLRRQRPSVTVALVPVETEIEAAIDADITRTSHAPHAEQWPALRHVLVAFASRHPHIGYCQGMNELAAVLLREFNETEDPADFALAGLTYLVDEVFPHYHSPSLLGLHMDCAVIETLLHQNDPHLVHHMQSLGLNMEILCTNWLMACFATTAPPWFHVSVLDMIFAAESATAASAVLVVASVAIILHLSTSLIHQHDTGGVLLVIKRFLATQSSPSPDSLAFLSLVRTLQRQLPLHELHMMREVHAAAVQEKLVAFQAKKAAIKEATSAATPSKSPPPPSSSSSRLKRFLGNNALKKAPTLFGKRWHDPTEDSTEKSRADEFEDFGRDDARGDWDLLHSQLQHTTNLLEMDAIDTVECAHIKERIVHTWSAARHTPAHAQTRVDLLKASLFVAPSSHSQPTSSSRSKAQSMVSRHTARARASLEALGVKWRSRSPSKQSDVASVKKKNPLSPTALQLSEIADSYFGGEITKDQRIRRKADLIAKSLFPDDEPDHPDNGKCPT